MLLNYNKLRDVNDKIETMYGLCDNFFSKPHINLSTRSRVYYRKLFRKSDIVKRVLHLELEDVDAFLSFLLMCINCTQGLHCAISMHAYSVSCTLIKFTSSLHFLLHDLG
jgi:hypothetical protein